MKSKEWILLSSLQDITGSFASIDIKTNESQTCELVNGTAKYGKKK